MKKVSLNSNSVAYFDDRELVDVPGFYVLEGEPETTEGTAVYDGGEFAIEKEYEVDGEKRHDLKSDDRGRPIFIKAPELKERISVTHETNMTPGKRVYASPDGEGFVWDDPGDPATTDHFDVAGGENS